jgi:hypothetical protein
MASQEESQFTHEFKCPKCQGSLFGTDMTKEPPVGYCHSYTRRTGASRPCDFSWLRTPDEDNKVFIGERRMRVPSGAMIVTTEFR